MSKDIVMITISTPHTFKTLNKILSIYISSIVPQGLWRHHLDN